MKMTHYSEITGREITHWNPIPVKLLKGPFAMPPIYTSKGELAKRQPTPIVAGDIVYAVFEPQENKVRLVPFALAGEGYELVIGAIEGIDYE